MDIIITLWPILMILAFIALIVLVIRFLIRK